MARVTKESFRCFLDKEGTACVHSHAELHECYGYEIYFELSGSNGPKCYYEFNADSVEGLINSFAALASFKKALAVIEDGLNAAKETLVEKNQEEKSNNG